MTSQYVPVIIELVPLTKSWMSVYFVTEATANRSTRVPACDDVTTQVVLFFLGIIKSINYMYFTRMPCDLCWNCYDLLCRTCGSFWSTKSGMSSGLFFSFGHFSNGKPQFSAISPRNSAYSYAHGTPLRQYFAHINLPWSYIEEEQQIRPTSPSEITHWPKAISVA